MGVCLPRKIAAWLAWVDRCGRRAGGRRSCTCTAACSDTPSLTQGWVQEFNSTEETGDIIHNLCTFWVPNGGNKGCENLCFYSDWPFVLLIALSIILCFSRLSCLGPLAITPFLNRVCIFFRGCGSWLRVTVASERIIRFSRLAQAPRLHSHQAASFSRAYQLRTSIEIKLWTMDGVVPESEYFKLTSTKSEMIA